ncbi:MAG: hypothetical protein H5T98_09645 [Syntrophomonadaceae bacterium]|nr:hypothetical protein [Syntrophomonadaceae bacterium]
MKDHAQALRQQIIRGEKQTVAHKSHEQKLAEAMDWLGKKWCLHSQSTLKYRGVK